MSATERNLPELGIWHSNAHALAAQPDATAASWLFESGLLTQRLRSACGDRFHMRVLREQVAADAQGLHREVLLCCATNACVYAQTDIPAATLQAHRWLQELGEEPLGETLRSRADVSRGDFRYALLNPATLPLPTTDAGTEPVWARRSEFHVGAAALTVTEVFLPALQACQPR